MGLDGKGEAVTGLVTSGCWRAWGRFCGRISCRDRSRGRLRIEIGSDKEWGLECNYRRTEVKIAGRGIGRKI